MGATSVNAFTQTAAWERPNNSGSLAMAMEHDSAVGAFGEGGCWLLTLHALPSRDLHAAGDGLLLAPGKMVYNNFFLITMQHAARQASAASAQGLSGEIMKFGLLKSCSL